MINHTEGECLKELFRNVHCVEEILEQLSRLSSLLLEISVNAAIASGHAESQSKIFSEIAKQIGTTSTLLLSLSERSKKRSSQISTQVLTSIVNSSQREKFSAALVNIREAPNEIAIKKVCTKLGLMISKQLENANSNLAHLKPEQDHINQIINRISSIVMSLRILVSSAESGEEMFLLPIAQSLENASMQVAQQSSSLLNYINSIEISLGEKCNCMKEYLYVT